MSASENETRPVKKRGGIPPGIILLVLALIIFGLMFAFNYLENQNPDWLRPTG